eukprot:333002_1
MIQYKKERNVNVVYTIPNQAIQNNYNATNISINTITQLPDAIIQLMHNKYNYMNAAIKKLNTNRKTYSNKPTMDNTQSYRMKQFQRLTQPCMNSIQSFPINQKLMLPNNISFFIIKILGRGLQGQSFLVNMSTNYYALKLFRKHTYTAAPKEYTILKRIEEYCTYFNVSHSLLKIPFLHPTLPGYYIPSTRYKNKQPRFFFINAILNGMKWTTLMDPKTNDKLLSSIIGKGTDMNSFFISCYRDIMNIFYALYNIKAFHNDFTETNILINYKTLQCYLIDFGEMFYQKSNVFHSKKLIYKCLGNTCSPLSYYYLTSLSKRQHFIKYYNESKWGEIIGKNALAMLCEFAMYDKQYQITSMILEGFIQLNYQQNSTVSRMNNEIYVLRNVKRGRIDSIWCKRLKMLTLLRKHQNKISDKFWKLLNIFENDWMFMNTSICF